MSGIGAWTPSVGSNKTYQQAVIDFPNGNVAVGGSEHNLQLWNRDRTQMLDAPRSPSRGGDTQLIETFGCKTYVGCHCGNWVYEGTNDWTSPTGFRAIKPINLIGAWDTATWQQDTTWYPSSLKGAKGEGVPGRRHGQPRLPVGRRRPRALRLLRQRRHPLARRLRPLLPAGRHRPTTPTCCTPPPRAPTSSAGAPRRRQRHRLLRRVPHDRVIGTVWAAADRPGGDRHPPLHRAAVDARGNRSASPGARQRERALPGAGHAHRLQHGLALASPTAPTRHRLAPALGDVVGPPATAASGGA
ncbi:MAG: hypothetical protein R2711_06950 [Acidimicrobiales bacterium]